ncbi:MAG: hypothetical protein ACYS8W_21575, partial [Planctomycetota bacterium]
MASVAITDPNKINNVSCYINSADAYPDNPNGTMYGVVNFKCDEIPPVADDAVYMSQTVPVKMVCGQDYSVSVTMLNIGSATWPIDCAWKLGSQNPQDNNRWMATNRVLVSGEDVLPFHPHTFTWDVTAPASPANYDFQWRMVHESVTWFGDFTDNVVVECVDYFTWTGGTSTNWNTATNWDPQPMGGKIVGSAAGYPNANVVIDSGATFNPTMSGNLSFNNITIQSGKTLTGSTGTVTVSGQISGAGNFAGGSGTLRLTKVGTGANAPIVLGYNKFNDTVGTVSYEGAGNQKIWSDCGDNSYRYYNINLAGSGTKNFNGNRMSVHRQITINGVTCSVDNSSQNILPNRAVKNNGIALEMLGTSLLTGSGGMHCYGNVNVGPNSDITLNNMRICSYNDGTTKEDAHLNISSGATVDVNVLYAIQTGSHSEPIDTYIHGPGSFTTGTLFIYSYNGDVTLHFNNDLTVTGTLQHSHQVDRLTTRTYLNDMGAYRIDATTLNDARDNGSVILDSGGQIFVTGNYEVGRATTIAHSNSVLDVNGTYNPAGPTTISAGELDSDGEFDPVGNLTMTGGELYIADNDPSWTWSATPGASTVYYDGGDQTVCLGGQTDDWQNGVTFDIVTKTVRSNPERYGSESALDMTSTAQITGAGTFYCMGNGNLAANCHISIGDFRLYSRNNDIASLEVSHLNIGSGSSVNATSWFAIQQTQQGANEPYPILFYIHGPGEITATNFYVYGYNGSLTCYLDANLTCNTLSHSRGTGYNITTTRLDDVGAHTINTINHIGNGSTILDSGTDLYATGNVTISGPLEIKHAGSVVNVDGEFDIGTLAMTNGELYIADNDPTMTQAATFGGTVYYDGAGQQVFTGSSDYFEVYNNLVIRGTGIKSVAGPVSRFDVNNDFIVEGGATFRIDNSSGIIVLNKSAGTALDIKSGGTVYLVTNAQINCYGTADIAGTITGDDNNETLNMYYCDVIFRSTGVASLYRLRLYCDASTWTTCTAETGADVSPYLYIPWGKTAGGCSSYLGPAPLTPYNLRMNSDGGGALLNFFYQAPISSSIIEYSQYATISDSGDFDASTGVLQGNGNYILDDGGSLFISGNCTIQDTLEISNSSSVVDVDGEFDMATLVMNAGTLKIGDDDPSFTPTLPLGGTIAYDGANDQSIFTTTYNNLAIGGTGTKSLTTDLTVNGLADIQNGVFDIADYTLFLDSVMDITGGTLFCNSAAASIENASASFQINLSGGQLDIHGIYFSGFNVNGLNVTAGTIKNLDNISWNNGNPAGAMMNFGNSDLIVFDDYVWSNHYFDNSTAYSFYCQPWGAHDVVNLDLFTGDGIGEDYDFDSGVAGVEIYWGSSILLPPSLFRADSLTPDSITWRWVDNTGVENGYEVLEVGGAVLVQLDCDINVWLESDLSENTEYTRLARAFQTPGPVYTNNSVSASAYTACENPTDGEFSVTNVSHDSMTLKVALCPNQTSGLTAAQFDDINDSPGADETWVTSIAGNEFVLIDDGLQTNTEYVWRVRYRNGDGVPSGYNPSPITKWTLTRPPAPDNFSLVSDVARRVVLTVDVPPNGTSGNSGSEFILVSSTGLGGDNSGVLKGIYTYIDTGLTPNTTYTYQVRLYNHDGIPTTWSAAKTVVVKTRIPGTPIFSMITSHSVLVEWASNQNPGWTEYELQRSVNGSAWDSISSRTGTALN